MSRMASSASVGLSKDLEAANADGGQHGAHHREHRPLVVDDRDHKCIKIADQARDASAMELYPYPPPTGLGCQAASRNTVGFVK